jgi:hypothetical protein
MLRSVGTVLVSLGAIAFPLLALPALLFAFLSYLSLPREPASLARWQRLLHVASGAVASVAVIVFLLREGVPGIVEGGTRAAGGRAVSRLREILFAEDAARKQAAWDPDGDGIGAALLIGELSAEIGLRGGARLHPPLLERYPKLDMTRAGPAIEIGGFWFMVCLPAAGGFTSEPNAKFDEELAERRFVAYAWPSGRAPGLKRAYFIDEHDRIQSAPSGETRRSGADHPPRCDDALVEPTRSDWIPWRGKKPRTTLPGE